MNSIIMADADCAVSGDCLPRPLAKLALIFIGALALTFFLVVLLRPADLPPAEHGDLTCWSAGIRADHPGTYEHIPCPMPVT